MHPTVSSTVPVAGRHDLVCIREYAGGLWEVGAEKIVVVNHVCQLQQEQQSYRSVMGFQFLFVCICEGFSCFVHTYYVAHRPVP